MKNAPIAKAEMLIRKPVEEVFEAFVNSTITSKFWFSNGSGRLQAGKQVFSAREFEGSWLAYAEDPAGNVLGIIEPGTNAK